MASWLGPCAWASLEEGPSRSPAIGNCGWCFSLRPYTHLAADPGEGTTSDLAPLTLPSSPQPAVELSPVHRANLRVEGVGVKKAKKQMPPTSKVNFSSSISDTQPPEVRRSLAMPDLAPGPPQPALPQDLKDEGSLLPLPVPSASSAEGL